MCKAMEGRNNSVCKAMEGCNNSVCKAMEGRNNSVGKAMEGRSSSVGKATVGKARRSTGAGLVPQCSRWFFFTSQSLLLSVLAGAVFLQPPSAVVCISICAHVKQLKPWNHATVRTHGHAAHTDVSGQCLCSRTHVR